MAAHRNLRRSARLFFAVVSCPTMREAAETALRYADLSFTVAEHEMQDHGDEVWLIRHDRCVPEEIRRLALERDVAAIWTIQQDVLPMRLPIVRVDVAGDLRPVYEVFGAVLGVEKIRYGAERSILVGMPVGGWPMRARHSGGSAARPSACWPKSCQPRSRLGSGLGAKTTVGQRYRLDDRYGPSRLGERFGPSSGGPKSSHDSVERESAPRLCG
ncbi:AraC family transcriptional regulator ligand-binding domain-containing protein [Nocardia sp. JCM 34519]|uniref:AraC family transcriptional regulator ligand-binding domain-containing protein n=1 Tax=Nocardia sp. JCM 34519 TaxID=2876118 RepID=UPI001CE3C466|nr:AraC family transcriptional regulator ligand-binding domain-containing protein [Nocardia sp. JCM 34519]